MKDKLTYHAKKVFNCQAGLLTRHLCFPGELILFSWYSFDFLFLCMHSQEKGEKAIGTSASSLGGARSRLPVRYLLPKAVSTWQGDKNGRSDYTPGMALPRTITKTTITKTVFLFVRVRCLCTINGDTVVPLFLYMSSYVFFIWLDIYVIVVYFLFLNPNQ